MIFIIIYLLAGLTFWKFTVFVESDYYPPDDRIFHSLKGVLIIVPIWPLWSVLGAYWWLCGIEEARDE